MKKIIYSALLTLAVACSKDNQAVIENTPENGRTVTITATIADESSTKINMTEDSGLKGTWNATETMTVVSIKNSVAIAYDLFTSVGEEGRKSAKFTGTITSTGAEEYVCYYPAIKPTTDPSDVNAYASDKVVYCGKNDLRSLLYIPRSEANTCYIQMDDSYVNQVKNNDINHLAKRLILKGLATVDGENINVAFKHYNTVIKFNLTFPTTMSGQNIGIINLKCTKADDTGKHFCADRGWGWIYGGGELACGGSDDLQMLFLGGWPEDGSGLPSGLKVPADGKMTVFMLTYIKYSIDSGDKWIVQAQNESSQTLASKTLVWKSAKSLEKGKMYTIDVALDQVK